MQNESIVRVIPADLTNEGYSARLDAAMAEICGRDDVKSVTAQAEQCRASLDRLLRARKNLYARQHEVAKAVRLVRESAAPALIHDFGDESSQIDTAKLVEKSLALQEEERLLTAAIQRLVEEELPWATIQHHRMEAEKLALMAKALENAAGERSQQLAQMVAQAADFECEIAIDTSSGLSGSLLRSAAQMKAQGQAELSSAEDEEQRWRAIRQAQKPVKE